MAELEKMAFVIKPNQLWDWQSILKRNFLIAHINPESITNSYTANYSSSSMPGSPLPLDMYINGSPHVFSFNLEFDDTHLIVNPNQLGFGNILTYLSTQESIDWLQAIQLPDVNSYTDVGVCYEPPLILWIWGDRPIYDFRITVGDITERRFSKKTKKCISATVPITLTRYLGSYLQSIK